MNDKPDIPRILYVDFPAESDNHLRNLAGIRRYASARGWDVATLPREETTPAAVKAICAGASDAPPPIGCVVEASGGHHNILPPRLFGNVPIVYLDPPKPLPWRGTEAVTCDHAAVAKAAFEELADAKPPCFAVVASDSGLPWNIERIAAFGALCIADGRELRVFPARSGERPERRLSRLSKWLAALPRRSAVFAVNDATALVVAEAALSIPRHIPKELCVYNGDGAGCGSYGDSSLAVDPTHWYRFVATTLLDEGKSDIAVYDMGTAHPTLATATPDVPVETFTGVNFRLAAAKIGGVSSLCISGMGTLDNTLDMSAGVFWDNIRIDHRKDGFMMIVR